MKKLLYDAHDALDAHEVSVLLGNIKRSGAVVFQACGAFLC